MSNNHTYWSCWSSSASSIPGPSIYTGTSGTCYPLAPAATPYPLDQPAIFIPLTVPYHIITSPATSPLDPLKLDFDWNPKPAKKILRKPLRMIRIREDA